MITRPRTWIDIVQAGTGKQPIIYTGRYAWNDDVGSSRFGGYTLWIANYGAPCPELPVGWNNWGLWQATAEPGRRRGW